MRGRILVPLVAGPFYLFAQRYISAWDSVSFALLVSNSIFTAFAACFLVSIGGQVTREPLIGVLTATLYLLSFAVSNLQLAGLVDAGEACVMLALTWSMISGKWKLLPVLGVVGALAKETFVPFATVFAATWCLAEWRAEKRIDRVKLFSVLSLIISSLVTIVLLHSLIAKRAVWPWDLAAAASGEATLFSAMVAIVTDHGFWYVFIWLLPLGIFGLRRIPRPWLAASIATALVAFIFATWKDMWGTAARPIFNAVGPMLSLASGIFLAGFIQNSKST
jgi:hypothetical protein